MSVSRFTSTNADRDDEREALHDGVVARADRVEQRLAHAGQVEDRLGQDGTADQRAERQADHRDDGQQRVAHGVAAHDQELAQPLGAGGAHVVEAEVVEQLTSGSCGR